MMKFKIVTPDGIVFNGEVDKVTLPTSTGEITILPNHIPLLSVLMAGELVITKGSEQTAMAVSGGMVEIRPNNEVYVMADTAERAEHIDIERAEQARVRAQELLSQKREVEEEIAIAQLQAKIEKEMARSRVGRKYRKLPPIQR